MQQLTKDFFTANRNKLVSSMGGNGLIIVPGNARMQRSGDTAFPFRQDSNLYYLTGVSEPCATLVINLTTHQEWLMVPMRSGITAIFDGQTDITQITDQSGIAEVLDEQEGYKRLRALANLPWYTPAKPSAQLGDMSTNPFRATVITKLSRFMAHLPKDIRPQLAAMRSIKAPEELQLIEHAAAITHHGLAFVQEHLKSFANEREIEAELTKQFKIQGASGHAFQPVIASGSASCTMHYFANNAPLQNGSVLLFDVGAEMSNYSADISRTIVFGSKPTSRQTEVIAAVTEAQQEIIAWLKPGYSWRQLAEYADKTVAQKLINLKLVPKQYQANDVRQYFPHAVSHFLGLDTHDVGDYSQPITEGMVITVEPGIYIKEESLGVRIEDGVVITKNGAKTIGDSSSSLL